jgi:hypothetical protein
LNIPFPKEIQVPRLSRRAVLIVGFIIGMALWLVPWLLLGASVPWDGHGPAYPVVLFLIGLVLGFFGPGRPGAAVAGVFAGQLLALIYRVLTNPAGNDTWMISVLLLAGYTFVVSGAGALLGSTLRRQFLPQAEDDRRVGDRRSRGNAS